MEPDFDPSTPRYNWPTFRRFGHWDGRPEFLSKRPSTTSCSIGVSPSDESGRLEPLIGWGVNMVRGIGSSWPTIIDAGWGWIRRVFVRTFGSRHRDVSPERRGSYRSSSQSFVATRMASVPSFTSKYSLLDESLGKAPHTGEQLAF